MLQAEAVELLGVHHHLPIISLASGRTTLVDKFLVIMHAFWLVCGAIVVLQAYCRSVVAITSDFGVEFGLNNVAPTLVGVMFPWLAPVPEGQVLEGTDDEWEVREAVVDEDADSPIGLSEAIAVPGLLHIIHNCTNDLLDAIPLLSDAVDVLSQVATFIRQEHTCLRLRESCLSEPRAKHFDKEFRKYDAKIHRGRWGTVAYAVDQTLEIEKPLRAFWSIDKYKAAAGPRGDKEPDAAKSVEAIDEAIQDDDWWSKLMTLNALAMLIRALLEWAEGCPCHSHLIDNRTPAELIRCFIPHKNEKRHYNSKQKGDGFSVLSGGGGCQRSPQGIFSMLLTHSATCLPRACSVAWPGTWTQACVLRCFKRSNKAVRTCCSDSPLSCRRFRSLLPFSSQVLTTSRSLQGEH